MKVIKFTEITADVAMSVILKSEDKDFSCCYAKDIELEDIYYTQRDGDILYPLIKKDGILDPISIYKYKNSTFYLKEEA